jgi:hypothetical protein
MAVPPAEVRVNPSDPARDADHGAETAAVGSAARRRALRWALRLVQLGPVVILAILVIVMGIPYFFKSNNLTNLGFQTAVPGLCHPIPIRSATRATWPSAGPARSRARGRGPR